MVSPPSGVEEEISSRFIGRGGRMRSVVFILLGIWGAALSGLSALDWVRYTAFVQSLVFR